MSTKPTLYLGVAGHDLKLKRDEFAEAHFEEPWRYERVKGRLFVMPPAGPDHQRPNNRLRDYLGAYALAHPERVDCVFSEAWIAVGSKTDRISDIGVYLISSKTGSLRPSQPPDLVFEIVSGGEDRKRDYVHKRAEYLRSGVRKYVIVDRLSSVSPFYAARGADSSKAISAPKNRTRCRCSRDSRSRLSSLF